jgi:hypothetical protein
VSVHWLKGASVRVNPASSRRSREPGELETFAERERHLLRVVEVEALDREHVAGDHVGVGTHLERAGRLGDGERVDGRKLVRLELRDGRVGAGDLVELDDGVLERGAGLGAGDGRRGRFRCRDAPGEGEEDEGDGGERRWDPAHETSSVDSGPHGSAVRSRVSKRVR